MQSLLNPLLVLLSCAATINGDAGVKLPGGTIRPQVINGNTTHIDDARFMVQVYTRAPGKKFWSCGGTLISQWHVLTAGHCTDLPADQMLVYAGASERRKMGRQGAVYAVKTFRRHPKYALYHDNKNNSWVNYDVSVLRLKTKVPLGPKTALIRVVAAGKTLAPKTIVKTSGWGIYKSDVEKASRKLRTGSYAVISNAECRRKFAKDKLASAITPQEFCAASTPVSAFCSGDSGGPAYIGDVQYGVVSWGSCGYENSPSVYANLAEKSINKFIADMKKIL